ncbi:DUF1007 family protein [Actinobacillus vicugnae]|uniref:DUF1007 family protein n=1 Tax=Actinobacillus vicugnae TaxID=2573093 RepID=UPI0012424067|nr:DUF1007 family protein [Actinobacillus vicugnae]
MKLVKLLSVFFAVSFSSQLFAHPHSFVDLKNKVLVEGTKLNAFEMEWMLDEIASAELIYEVNNSADKTATEKSITDEMTQTAIEAHYFSYLYDAKDQPIKFSAKPRNTRFDIHGNRVVFYLTIPLSKPHDLKNNPVRFYTYEPSYYMGMEYNNVQALSINTSQCKATLTQPQISNSLRLYASSLDKNQSPDMPENEDNSLGAQFAQKVTVVCE